MAHRDPVGMPASYRWRLHRNVLLFVLLLLALLAAMAWAEQAGLSRNLIGPIFLFSTVMIYALIGISGRTTDAEEYYVAGRRVPAMYNGMATAADWMSAASSSAWRARFTCRAFPAPATSQVAWPTSWAGPVVFAWWPC